MKYIFYIVLLGISCQSENLEIENTPCPQWVSNCFTISEDFMYNIEKGEPSNCLHLSNGDLIYFYKDSEVNYFIKRDSENIITRQIIQIILSVDQITKILLDENENIIVLSSINPLLSRLSSFDHNGNLNWTKKFNQDRYRDLFIKNRRIYLVGEVDGTSDLAICSVFLINGQFILSYRFTTDDFLNTLIEANDSIIIMGSNSHSNEIMYYYFPIEEEKTPRNVFISEHSNYLKSFSSSNNENHLITNHVETNTSNTRIYKFEQNFNLEWITSLQGLKSGDHHFLTEFDNSNLGAITSLFNNNNQEIVFSKINNSGNLVWENIYKAGMKIFPKDIYKSNDIFNLLIYNPIDKKHYFIKIDTLGNII